MNVVYAEEELEEKLSKAADVSPLHPVVITKFIDGAQEIDVDAVAYKGKLLIHAISEHVENAGVHSGDATLVLPPFSLSEGDMARLKVIAEKVAAAFKISGPYNMQIIRRPAENGEEAELKVIECNLRASRSFPFVSKVLGHNFIETATAAITGHQVPEPVDLMAKKRDYTSIKVAQFSWTRLGGADPFLGVGKSGRLLHIVSSDTYDIYRNGEYWRSRFLRQGYPRGLLGLPPKYHWLQGSQGQFWRADWRRCDQARNGHYRKETTGSRFQALLFLSCRRGIPQQHPLRYR